MRFAWIVGFLAACSGNTVLPSDLDGGSLPDGIDATPENPTIDAAPAGPIDATPDVPAIDATPDVPAIDAAPPAVQPTWSSEMTSADDSAWFTRAQPEGAVQRGLADGAGQDGYVARLRFPGLPALGNNDRVGPAFASEMATKASFHFGTYRMRVKLAACTPGEEVVNGLFTYFNDGNDHDGDGIADNSEIDIEVLCGSPEVIFLTVYTDYSPTTGEFRKWTRAIDFATGDLWAAPTDHMYGIEKTGNDPSLKKPGFLQNGFLELGFEWRTDKVRYFATIDGVERTLAELTQASHVPQLPGLLMFNVWHSRDHWFGGGGPPDYPAQDATLTVDWVRYWE